MYYTSYYSSPIGQIMLASNEGQIVGLWIKGQKYFASSLLGYTANEVDIPILISAKAWLDRYFAGEKPEIFEMPLAPIGSDFRQEVWKILCEIPYGEVITYKAISEKLAERMGKKSMSYQAVGGAVGHNPISIIIPCHRVVGSDGSLTGYAGGINNKIKLLELEGVDLSNMYIPKRKEKVNDH